LNNRELFKLPSIIAELCILDVNCGFYFESSFIKIEVRNLNIIIGGYFELSSFIMPKVGNLDAMNRSYFTYFQNDRGQYFFYLKYNGSKEYY